MSTFHYHLHGGTRTWIITSAGRERLRSLHENAVMCTVSVEFANHRVVLPLVFFPAGVPEGPWRE